MSATEPTIEEKLESQQKIMMRLYQEHALMSEAITAMNEALAGSQNMMVALAIASKVKPEDYCAAMGKLEEANRYMDRMQAILQAPTASKEKKCCGKEDEGG